MLRMGQQSFMDQQKQQQEILMQTINNLNPVEKSKEERTIPTHKKAKGPKWENSQNFLLANFMI